MKARQIIRMLPSSIFTELSKKYQVDHKVKKLPAVFLFKTIIKSLFSGEKTTLRTLKAQFESQQFQKYTLQQKKIEQFIVQPFIINLIESHQNFSMTYFKQLKKLVLCQKMWK